MDIAARTSTELEVPAQQGRAVGLIYNTLGIALSTSVLIVATIATIYSLVLALQWYNQPFVNAFVSTTLTVNNLQAFNGIPWQADGNGLKTGDKIQAVNGESFVPITVNSAAAYNKVLNQLPADSTVTIDVLRPKDVKNPNAGSDPVTLTIQTGHLPLGDFFVQFGIAFLTALAALVIAWIVWSMRRQQIGARQLINVCAAGAVCMLGRFDAISTFQIISLWLFAICGLGASLLAVGLQYPYPVAIVRRMRWFTYMPAVLFLGIFAVSDLAYHNYDIQTSDSAQLLAVASAALAGVILMVMLWQRRRNAPSPRASEQATILFIGAVVSIVPAFFWIFTILLSNFFGFNALSFSAVFAIPPTLAFPLVFTYSLLQYRSLNSDRIVSESIIYATLGILLVLSYLLITAAVYALTAGVINPSNPILIVVTLFVIAVAFTPVRLRMERLVDRAFFRQRRVNEQRLELFSRKLTAGIELPEIVQNINQELSEGIMAEYAFIFLRIPPSEEFEAAADPSTGKAPTDIRFRGDSSLIKLLEQEANPIRLDTSLAPLASLQAERARLAVLNTPVLIRLRSARRLNGFLALGPRQDRQTYSPEDLRYLEGIATQTSAAVERVQMIIEAQRNERDLRVVGQVSEALNIAMDFDSLQEFIFNQVDRIISAPNFYIVLVDRQSKDLSYTFFQENEERIPEKEERSGYRWPMGRDLISEVITLQQPIRTENYPQEMLRRDSRAKIENPNLHAWMGVPMNAGDGFVRGCIAVASTDPAVSYTADQMRLFVNIAQLAATAIYKTRLFSETETRARQMKALNDVSSVLATEIKDLSSLLQIITQSAVEILDCEAGSLLLKEENGDDLIFTLAVGGGGQELVNQRIPSGSGIAGTAVKTGQPVIENDVQHSKRWFGDLTQSEGNRPFSSRAILAVPLFSRGKALGVLEVINKKDRSRFVDSDVNLLTTFAGQAAVAIENAQLYEQTNEALAIRLQQLDKLQQIDQELNRNLDLKRVTEVTIRSAMGESRANAGALAFIQGGEPEMLYIVNSIGYPEGILTPGAIFGADEGIFGKIYQSKQETLMNAEEIEINAQQLRKVPTLPGVQSQLGMPLSTGNQVSSILLLESTKAGAFDMMTVSNIKSFVEHANTAITNAQLFARLDDATKGRSELMGIVAHEMNQPITSIKGYADILITGVTGKLSDQQQNMLGVIRGNVVRIQQLVADLRDVTAQENGKLTLRMAAVSFNNVIIETLRPQQRAIDDKNQQVVLNVPDNLPLVWGDEQRLIQVMTNFVSNAYKYTPPGGTIIIFAEDVPDQWTQAVGEQVIHCAVSDTGIGMSPEDLKKLGTAYWRSDNPLAQEQKGTGLGVRLVRGLIEAHGGKMWVESTLGEGTTFHFTVPLAPETERPSGTIR